MNTYKMFDIAENTSIYTDEIKRTMTAVTTHPAFVWEKRSHDGYADTIESMLYLLPWFDIPECHRWVDEEIEKMFRMQLSSGLIKNGEYLDGNFIRTSFLYASYKSQGLMIDPWREDVSLGAAYDNAKKELYVYLNADNPWKGVLKFDLPRHQIIWNLSFEYPRLNESPEWFVVEPKESYRVINLTSGEEAVYSGDELAKGLTIDIKDKEIPSSFKVTLNNAKSLVEP